LTDFSNKWEKGFVALTRFKAREGHCRVPRDHVECNCSLGPWVSVQRYKRKTMSAERKQRLNKIGFIWDWREYSWEIGFTALAKFKEREGHCCVPQVYIEGDYNLGQWVSVQRYQRKTIAAERELRLNKIGFVWNWREDAWENGFAALTKFKARKGNCLIPALHVERKFKLGQWVTMQRRSKNEMSAKRRKRLNDIGFVWRGR
jgi:hypothetical protein